MADHETYYCTTCGSTDIHHEAVAKHNPATAEYELVQVDVKAWCTQCETAGVAHDYAFGVVPQDGDEAVSAGGIA
jgi:hypothetical protein